VYWLVILLAGCHTIQQHWTYKSSSKQEATTYVYVHKEITLERAVAYSDYVLSETMEFWLSLIFL